MPGQWRRRHLSRAVVRRSLPDRDHVLGAAAQFAIGHGGRAVGISYDADAVVKDGDCTVHVLVGRIGTELPSGR